jgi:hypothetical protein
MKNYIMIYFISIITRECKYFEIFGIPQVITSLLEQAILGENFEESGRVHKTRQEAKEWTK